MSRIDEIVREYCSSIENIVIVREFTNILHSLSPIIKYLDDPFVTDIFVMSSGAVFLKSFGKGKSKESLKIDINSRKLILTQIAKWADIQIANSSFPTVEATIPFFNARITGRFPPLDESASFTIRKPPKKIFTLDDYVTSRRLSEERKQIIVNYIENRKNIIVSGGTNTGKTTFTNAVLDYMVDCSPEDHFLIVQDNAELQCKAEMITPLNIKRSDSVKAVEHAMRSSPDRIIFGEVRDGYVMADLLDAWNTGHPGGVSTIHADSCLSTFVRINTLLKQRYTNSLPDIHSIIHLVVHLSQHPELGVYIDEVYETNQHTKREFELLHKFNYEEAVSL